MSDEDPIWMNEESKFKKNPIIAYKVKHDICIIYIYIYIYIYAQYT